TAVRRPSNSDSTACIQGPAGVVASALIISHPRSSEDSVPAERSEWRGMIWSAARRVMDNEPAAVPHPHPETARRMLADQIRALCSATVLTTAGDDALTRAL